MPLVPLDEIALMHNNVCKAITDPRRIQILYALSDGPSNVSALAELLGMPQPTLSRHLSVLRERGIVAAERDGTTVIYRLSNPHIIQVLNLMRVMMRDLLDQQTSLLDSVQPEDETA